MAIQPASSASGARRPGFKGKGGIQPASSASGAPELGFSGGGGILKTFTDHLCKARDHVSLRFRGEVTRKTDTNPPGNAKDPDVSPRFQGEDTHKTFTDHSCNTKDHDASRIFRGKDARKNFTDHRYNAWDYDVFLSFRGEDTRKTFTDHLYHALDRVGIRTFRDNEELPKGKVISTELRNAIRRSRIFIVVFSQDYASSPWCLDELAEMVEECKNSTGHCLWPIFYYVNPSDVRKQTGTFAEAFAKHEARSKMATVQRWREALAYAAECAGWDPSTLADGYEAKFIEGIIDQILCELMPAHLDVAIYQVGIDSRVQEVKALLNPETTNVGIVGIYGMGGIGKTTIAKALYNQICYGFEGSSFLLDIKETSEKSDGLIQLQKQLLFDILKKNLKIDNIDRGINLIKERLCHKRILIVLDDVDDLDQIHKLVGNLRCFGSGSTFIVTTRDEGLLSQLGVKRKHKVKALNMSQSLELFSWHAFEMLDPKPDCLELSINAVKYSEGLPLALKVLGCLLKRRSNDECEDELKKLRRTPHEKIQKILRRSFDSLDHYTREMFLDIACFLIGMDTNYAMKIFEGCGFHPQIGFKVLEERSLMTIDYENKLRMHSLIQDMGKGIVLEKTTYSRLWLYEDFIRILHTNALEDVEGINISPPISGDKVVETAILAHVKRLRLLQINSVHVKLKLEDPSKALKWLYWYKCHLKSLPENFYPKDLAILDMQHSKISQLWKSYKMFNKLKVLNLSNSENLTISPNFFGIPHLEKLILESCTRLVKLHKSIGCLEHLVFLNLKGCKSLRYLPSSISFLESLEILDVSCCLKLEELPEQVEKIAFRELYKRITSMIYQPGDAVDDHFKHICDGFFIESCKSRELSSHVVHDGRRTTLSRLDKEDRRKALSCSKHKNDMLVRKLNYKSRSELEKETALSPRSKEECSYSWLLCFSSCISPKMLISRSLLLASVSGLNSLEELNLSYCDLSEDGFPVHIGSLPSLLILKLSGNNFRVLPCSIGRLPKLVFLEIDNCTALQSISVLPPSLWMLNARGCRSLEALPNSWDMNHSPIFWLSECHNLVDLRNLQSLESSFTVMAALVSESLFQHTSSMCDAQFRSIFLQSSEVPNWFSHKKNGPSISFPIPSLSEGKIRGLLLGASYQEMSYAPNDTSILEPQVAVLISNHRGSCCQFLCTEAPFRLHLAARCLVFQIPIITESIQGCQRWFLPNIYYLPVNFGPCCYVFWPKEKGYGMEVRSGDELEVCIRFYGNLEVHKYGIHLLVDKPHVINGDQNAAIDEEKVPKVMLLTSHDEVIEGHSIMDNNISLCNAAKIDNLSRGDVTTEEEIFEDWIAG